MIFEDKQFYLFLTANKLQTRSQQSQHLSTESTESTLYSITNLFDHSVNEGGVELVEGIDGEDRGRIPAGDFEQFIVIGLFSDSNGHQMHAHRLQLANGLWDGLRVVAFAVRHHDEVFGDICRFASGVVENAHG